MNSLERNNSANSLNNVLLSDPVVENNLNTREVLERVCKVAIIVLFSLVVGMLGGIVVGALVGGIAACAGAEPLMPFTVAIGAVAGGVAGVALVVGAAFGNKFCSNVINISIGLDPSINKVQKLLEEIRTGRKVE